MGQDRALKAAFLQKAVEFDDVIKVGRTQLMDAVPMRLGSEFRAFAVTVGEDIDRLREFANLLREVNLGGTAIGTGINTPENYSATAIRHLSEVSGVPLVPAGDLIEATSSLQQLALRASAHPGERFSLEPNNCDAGSRSSFAWHSQQLAAASEALAHSGGRSVATLKLAFSTATGLRGAPLSVSTRPDGPAEDLSLKTNQNVCETRTYTWRPRASYRLKFHGRPS